MSVVAVYAPTADAADNDKDSFYDQLQLTIDKIPLGDMLIVAGDWNAKPGQSDGTTHGIVGKFAIGQRCANGERLVDFASTNNMVVASTRFQHHRHHLITWYSSDGCTKSQIDHVFISIIH